jgi:hypothetical protein
MGRRRNLRAAFGAGSARAWWNPPQVISLSVPTCQAPSQTDRLERKGDLSNIGDGSAQRVSVYISRGGQYEHQKVAEAALLRPGGSVGFFLEQFDEAELWATWTPPPIRRRKSRIPRGSSL